MTQYDDLPTYDMTGIGFIPYFDDGDDIEAEETALARPAAEYDWVTAKADADAAEDAAMARLERDLAELSIEELEEAARAAELLSPDSTWGIMTIAAYNERLAELEAAEDEGEDE